MIATSIQPGRSPVPPSVRPESTPAAEPRDTVDTPTEVALLPIVDPAITSTLVMAGMVPATSPMPGLGLLASGTTLSARLGTRTAQIQYAFSTSGLTSQGTVTDPQGQRSSIAEKLTQKDPLSAMLVGQFGAAAENLTIQAVPNGLHLAGRIGTVPVDLTYGLATAPNQPGDSCGWAGVTGSIGGTPYSALAIFGPGQGQDLASVRVTGSLGADAIDKAYRVTLDTDASSLALQGGGSVAGTPQDVQMQVSLSPRQ